MSKTLRIIGYIAWSFVFIYLAVAYALWVVS